MKTLLLTLGLIGLTSLNACAQSQKADQKAIEKTLVTFQTSGDKSDTTALSNVMHPDFRVTANRLFGSSKVSYWNKAAYLGMIAEGKIGGVPRSFELLSLVIVGNQAFAQVEMVSSEYEFTNLCLLVKTEAGDWLLLEDVPSVKPASK